ncbi:hypothetical protein DdX_21273 [Ditylenchus destructor]|uniref:Uncharacterized protein n=1 Tax=Ditylenchus destructor TaxID=166010 RepID=A0AAD4MHK6_9BILA|nr:hypothetical protein DdX_21273 [Ditylenchus destructor]
MVIIRDWLTTSKLKKTIPTIPGETNELSHVPSGVAQGTRISVIAMENTGPAHIATVVDPPQSSAVHDNMEQPMEEVVDAEVKRHYAE